MNQRQITAEAKFRAGIILDSVLNGWEPTDLIERYGQDTVDRIAGEINVIAHRLIEQGSRTL